MWYYDLVIKRKSQRSTVFICETLDIIRINNFINLDHNSLFDREFRNIYVYDILNGSIKRSRNGEWIEEDVMQSPLDFFTGKLSRTPTLVIIHYVYDSEQAHSLSNAILSWATDQNIYGAGSVVVLFTSSASLFPETIRKFAYVVEVEPPNEKERRYLIKKVIQEVEDALIKKHGLDKYRKQFSIKFREEFVTASSGLDLHMIESATLESIFQERRIDTRYYTQYKIDFLRQYGIEYVEPKYGFEAVGGYNLLKQYIKNRIVKLIKNPKLAEKYSLTPPRGIIMFGLPGVGKTFFAKALAKEIGLPLLKIDPSTFLRGIVGETEARVKQITRMIESFAPVVVFIDEIDQIAMSRARAMITDSGVSRRLTNMLLDWLGDRDRKSIVIGATNFISDLDPAFIRPGRIDEIIPILLPDREARREILRIHTSVLRHMPIKDVDFDKLADETYAWTGAELEKLVIEAGFRAMENNSDVTMAHFIDALETIEVNVEERESRLRQMIEEAKTLENVNKAFLQQLVKSYSAKETKASMLAEYL